MGEALVRESSPSVWVPFKGTVHIRAEMCNRIGSANVVGNEIYFFYGGADRLIGLATAPLTEVLDFALNG